MKFDKKRCLKLIKKSDQLLQEGKFLCDFDKDELNQYFILLSDHIFWNSRYQYL